MLILVQHDVRDPQAFRAGVRANQDQLPAGLRPVQVLPNADGTAVTCLWEADSMDSVRSVIEESVGAFSQNTYYEVNTEAAMGLPT